MQLEIAAYVNGTLSGVTISPFIEDFIFRSHALLSSISSLDGPARSRAWVITDPGMH